MFRWVWGGSPNRLIRSPGSIFGSPDSISAFSERYNLATQEYKRVNQKLKWFTQQCTWATRQYKWFTQKYNWATQVVLTQYSIIHSKSMSLSWGQRGSYPSPSPPGNTLSSSEKGGRGRCAHQYLANICTPQASGTTPAPVGPEWKT